MQPRDFVYWLQGFMEIADPQTMTPDQIKMIKDHLEYVFKAMQVPTPQPYNPLSPFSIGTLTGPGTATC